MTSVLALLWLAPPVWLTDLEQAKVQASREHKLVLLNFSGSDWCGPCIRMHKELFGADLFAQYAQNHLVLVQADFPRLRKNQLPADQTRRNEALAATYNASGVFPLTVLLDADGKVIKTWEGNPGSDAGKFVAALKIAANEPR